jgi:tRNA A-37 threonylcarbamoyl transferase component Bud32
MIGEALGNYTLVAKLGSGSMGVVFLAEHKWIERRVAVKLLAQNLASNMQAVRRFFKEARATSLIRHPGIVDVFDCDIDARGRAYMVMEHLEGQTLAARLDQTGTLPWKMACLIGAQVADALGAAHDKGIVHRDLKPENVFLVGDRRDPNIAVVKVLDFGVAKLRAVDALARLTRGGALVGTPEYMSPEQCGASEEIDHRADVYGLGCVLFEMLSGQPPFVTSSVGELTAAHRYRQAPSLMDSCPDVPEWLAGLVARMLSKEPDQRPASMHAVWEELRERRSRPLLSAAVPARSMIELKAHGEDRRGVARRGRDRIAPVVRQLSARRGELAMTLAGVLMMLGAAWAVRRAVASERKPPVRAETVVLQPAAELAPPGAATLPAAVQTFQTAVAPNLLPSKPKSERAGRPPRRAGSAATPSRRPADTDGIIDL